jgi:hypothetical protein
MEQLTHVLRTTGEDPVARELPAGISLPSYVALLEDAGPLAGGGMRPLRDGIAEVKRMYEAPARDAGNAHAAFWGEKPL